MRVLTAAMPLAESADQLLSSCNVDALACLIVHKTLTTAAEQGMRDARQMLCDWLALVVAAAAERGNVQRQVRLLPRVGWVGGGGGRGPLRPLWPSAPSSMMPAACPRTG